MRRTCRTFVWQTVALTILAVGVTGSLRGRARTSRRQKAARRGRDREAAVLLPLDRLTVAERRRRRGLPSLHQRVSRRGQTTGHEPALKAQGQ